ncbi:putative Thioredoxin [Blattamonas nauphoetae]|uniref:Thioredoxin n=1 Tax=Blattamonas nauphoetae TaxID=2049346 RepID=A0ABQ9YHM7_9EUKA|nr:putative Thioredoxin [Blattamonas nauphoetae]
MSIIHAKTVSQYQDELNKHGDDLVVVDFSATWCGPCQKIKPVFENLPGKYPNVTFIHCDVDELRDLDEVDSIQGVPTFRFWKKGKKVAEFSGANESNLLSTIDKHK